MKPVWRLPIKYVTAIQLMRGWFGLLDRSTIGGWATHLALLNYLFNGQRTGRSSARRFANLCRRHLERVATSPEVGGYDIRHLGHAYASTMELFRESWSTDPKLRAELDRVHDELRVSANGAKYQCSVDFFFPFHLFFRRHLQHLAGSPGLRFLEIGCFEGMATCWMLDEILTHPSSHIDAIDTFDYANQDKSGRGSDGPAEDRDIQLIYAVGRPGAWAGGPLPSIEARFDFNVNASGRAPRVTKHVGTSHEVLRKLQPGSFDFIYIDGSHRARDVIEDAVLAWPLLKSGGRLIFDDYYWGRLTEQPQLAAPGIAIQSFMKLYSGRFRLLQKWYQVALEKTEPAAAFHVTRSTQPEVALQQGRAA
jgi:precorrin-6B methylase 2